MKSLINVFKKNLVNLVHLGIILVLLGACNDQKPEGNQPFPILESDIHITPINGGAIVTYSIPKDPDILYVMAEYERNGELFTERASIYVNSLTIEGFNTMNPVSATLYTVNDQEIKSAPLIFNFTPLEAPVSLASKSTHIIPYFGGILVSWENITKKELGIRVMKKEDEVMVEKDMYYSSFEFENRTFRGFESVETTFALTFEDQWGNISDTVYYVGTPLFEKLIEKPWIDMRPSIPYDNLSGNLASVWDGAIQYGVEYITSSGSAGCSFTFDLGKAVKLSQMAIWPSVQLGYAAPLVVYGNLNIMKFEMWGTKELELSKLTGNTSYWLHANSASENGLELPEETFMDDWVYLGHFEVERLDLLGGSEDEMFASGEEGFHFEIPIECDPVRYIRFFPLCTNVSCPIPSNWWRVMELSFWGDDTVSR